MEDYLGHIWFESEAPWYRLNVLAILTNWSIFSISLLRNSDSVRKVFRSNYLIVCSFFIQNSGTPYAYLSKTFIFPSFLWSFHFYNFYLNGRGLPFSSESSRRVYLLVLSDVKFPDTLQQLVEEYFAKLLLINIEWDEQVITSRGFLMWTYTYIVCHIIIRNVYVFV